MNREFAGITWYSSQIQAANPILILLFIPLFSYVLYPLIDRIIPLTPLRKIGIGFFICVIAFAVPTYIESQITGGQVVQFKRSPGEHAMRVTPQVDQNFYPVENLIDGRSDGTGWIAPFDSEGEQLDVVVRLRDQRLWKIDTVELNPHVAVQGGRQRADRTRSLIGVMEKFFSSQPQIDAGDEDIRKSLARDVAVLVSESRVGPWEQVGEISLRPEDENQRLTFDAVDAEYVMLRISSNHGGQHVALGELAIFTAGEPSKNVALTDTRPNIVWQLFAYVLLTAAEVMISITCLEFSYTQAPPALKSFIMSIYLLSVTLGNLLTGLVNRFIQNPDGSSRLEGPAYFLFFTSLIGLTAIAYLFIARSYRGQTYIQSSKPH